MATVLPKVLTVNRVVDIVRRVVGTEEGTVRPAAEAAIALLAEEAAAIVAVAEETAAEEAVTAEEGEVADRAAAVEAIPAVAVRGRPKHS